MFLTSEANTRSWLEAGWIVSPAYFPVALPEAPEESIDLQEPQQEFFRATEYHLLGSEEFREDLEDALRTESQYRARGTDGLKPYQAYRDRRLRRPR